MDHFVHLHVHTRYSLGNGLATIEALCARVRESGMRAIAITDQHSLAAVPELIQYTTQYDLKPIFGAQLDVGSILPESQPQSGTSKHIYSLILIATNAIGFRNLVRIVNQANQLNAQKKGPLPLAFIVQHQEGLIFLSGGYKSEIAFRLRQNQLAFASETVSQFSSFFGDKNFYLELIGENEPDRDMVNSALIALGRQYALPLVATNNVHYLTAEDALASRILSSFRTGLSLMLPLVPDRYLKNTAEMTAIFAQSPDAVENTRWIADRCEQIYPHNFSQIPYFAPPTGYDTESYLWELCQRGLTQKYHKPSLSLRQRLNEEFGLLRKKGWMDYTLILWDFCRFLREKGIQFSLDRTNHSYSLLNYVLDITRLDVVKYNFSSDFYYFGNNTPYPAVELEFDTREKETAVAYFRNRYGSAHIGGTLQYTSYSLSRWFTEVATRLHIPAAQVAPIISYFSSGTKQTVDEVINQEKELSKRIQQNPELEPVVTAVKSLQHSYLAQEVGPRTVVIARDPLFANYPLSYREDGTVFLQYTAEQVAGVKLLSIELRSQPLFSAVADALAQLQKRYAQSVDIYSFDLEDSRIYKSVRNAETVALPYLESSSLRSLLQELDPRNFTELTTAVALHRCGYPSGKLISDYLAGAKPNKAILSLHSALKQILGYTRGMILYQEQVLELVKTITMLPAPEATEIVRHLLTAPRFRKTDELRKRFIRAGTQAGFTESVVGKIWEFLLANLGHRVTKPEILTALELSIRCAHLKRNHPTEYFYGMIQQYGSSDIRLSSYINEAKRVAVTVRAPDINHSSTALSLEDGTLRLGLTLVAGVGDKIAENIISARANKRFISLFDFCRRTNPMLVTHRIIEHLIRSGACDSLVRYRSQLLAFLDETVTRARHFASLDSGNALFDLKPYTVAEESIVDPYPELEEFPLVERLAMEKQTTGVYLSASPLTPYQEFLKRIGTKPVRSILRFAGPTDHQYYIAGIVAEHTPLPKKGKLGLHFYLEDESGTVRLSLTPKQFAQYRLLFEKDHPLLVSVSVQKAEVRPALVVAELADLTELSEPLPGTLFIELKQELDRKQLKSLYALLHLHRGTNPVTIAVAGNLRADGFYGKLRKLKVTATQWLLDEIVTLLKQNLASAQMVGTLPLFEKPI
ncbi:MAG: DNA polymerase III subunit alpha [bacterium]|nr:DNA polymerase III subunit alpha [bacterium]